MQTSTSCPPYLPSALFWCGSECALSAIRGTLGGVFAGFPVWSAEGLQTGMVCRKKALEGDKGGGKGGGDR